MSSKIFILLLVVMLAFFNVSKSTPLLFYELETRTVVLEKFSCYLDWNDSKYYKDLTEPFKIVVIVNTNFFRAVNHNYGSRNIREKKVKIIKVIELKEIANSDVLFINNTLDLIENKVLEHANKTHGWIITDNKNYVEDRIHFFLNFYNNKLRFKTDFRLIKDDNLNVDHLYCN